MKSIAWALTCILVAVSLIACSGGGSSSNNNSSGSLAMKGTSGNAVDMNGTWKRCERKDLDQTDSLITATANGSQITVNGSIWDAPTTSNCQQTSNPDVVLTEIATVTLGAEATATWTDDHGGTLPPAGVPGNAKATKATFVYSSAIITLNSTTWRDNFNNGSMCGMTNWAIGVPTNVLNCPSIIESTTDIDYWVVDDSSIPLKLYTQNTGTAAYEVDSVDPLVKQ